VDPAAVSSVAHVYVGGFRESWITQVDVPLNNVNGADTVPLGGLPPRRITGAAQ
jgi:hypothetical protein